MRRALMILLLAACSSGSKESAATGSGSTASAGSAAKYPALGKRPKDPRRTTPPPGIAASALAVGAKAPDIRLTDATGATWSLADALTKHARVMLVFYRGDW